MDDVSRRPINIWAMLRVFAGGASGATLLWTLNVPAGILVGAVVGSACANLAWRPSNPIVVPPTFRHVGFVLLGVVAGVRLEVAAIINLAKVSPVLALSIVILLTVNLLLAVLLIRRYDIDPKTAVLATAPGGLSEIAGLALESRANLPLVVAVHTIRVLFVVLVALPLLVYFLPAS